MFELQNLQKPRFDCTRKTGSGGSNKKHTKTFIKTLKSKIQKDPTKSMQKMAREVKVKLSGKNGT